MFIFLQIHQDVLKNTNIKKEIDLLKSQANRCKNILLTLSKNPENLKDSFFNKTKISNLISLNFDKFNDKKMKLELNYKSNDNEPSIIYKDELDYGIGNIIQNAIQHSKLKMIVNLSWNSNNIFIEIIDDGKGFRNEVLDQIGKPYISKNKNGMGLGIFIAKNLIENIGGSIYFENSKKYGGSVEIKIKNVT